MISDSSFATPFWFGWRYLNFKRRTYSTFVNWVSVIGLACGVMLFIVVASVQNGLLMGVHARYMSVIPHAFVPGTVSPDMLRQLELRDVVEEVEPFFRSTGMVIGNDSSLVLQLQGVGEQGLNAVEEWVVSGSFDELREGVALNHRLAEDMGLEIGDSIRIMLMRLVVDGVVPLYRSLPLVATFDLGVDRDYDIGFIHVDQVDPLGVGGTGDSGFRIWLTNFMVADEALADLPSVETWSEEFGGLFLGFQLEKLMLSIFMSLVILLASFNLVAAQTIVINTKRADIGILSTIGASHSFVFRIFALQGSIIAVTGIALGTLLGYAVASHVGAIMAAMEQLTGVSYGPNDLFRRIPAQVLPTDVVVAVLVALVFSAIAVLYPVKRVLKANPVAALNQQADA